ncbi:MAG TPA: LPS export ABC transporter periplasmic protein LptC [Wenzhouxiangella sp.]
MIAIASLALVIVFVIRWWMPSDRTIRSAPTLPDTQFDYTLSDFRSEFFNTEGALEWVIEAPELVHDSKTKVATIQSPVIRIEPSINAWEARANQGTIYRNEDEIVLMGDVVIRQPFGAGERVIQTQRLHHDRRQRTISTNNTVEITQPGGWLEAGGVRIDLDTDTMEFLDHVQGEIFLDRRPADRTAIDR